MDDPERAARALRTIDDISGSTDRSVSTDRLLSAVANEHRRAILVSLLDAPDRTLSYDALVDRVTDRIRDDVARASDDRRRRVRIALHHTHLPVLDDARIVDYDTESGRVKFVGGELVQEILALVESSDADD